MARNTLRLDTSGFEGLLGRLESLGGNVDQAVENALTSAGKTIENDTWEAMKRPYLPAKGQYSSGDTEKSIIKNPAVQRDGSTAWIPVGFDFSKPGAGGFLITGTPKMAPDPKLKQIYKGKKYMKAIQDSMASVVIDEILKVK